jgi:hypothetical protein
MNLLISTMSTKNKFLLRNVFPILQRLLNIIFSVMIVIWAMSAHGENYHFRYVSLADKALPGYLSFSPSSINDGGQISGTVSNCDDSGCFDFHAAIYKDGVVTVLQPGLGGPINAGGTIGGSVLVDPVDFTRQSALFRKNKFDLISPFKGEVSSYIFSLNDSGTALVFSYDENSKRNLWLYKNGQTTEIDLGQSLLPVSGFISYTEFSRVINNQGIIAGITTTDSAFNGARGFRFDPRTGKGEILEPVSPDTLAWGMGINQRGDVLGYSFVSEPPYHERIGVWDKKGNFTTYVDVKTNSSYLLFNDNNLIVRTLVSGDDNSYLVKPGKQLNLADLVEGIPSGAKLYFIFDINNRGDMLGYDTLGGIFLLQRAVGN